MNLLKISDLAYEIFDVTLACATLMSPYVLYEIYSDFSFPKLATSLNTIFTQCKLMHNNYRWSTMPTVKAADGWVLGLLSPLFRL